MPLPGQQLPTFLPGQGPGIVLPGMPLLPTITGISPNTGRIAGGLTVMLTGANFRNNNDGTAPTVTFGGVAATNVTVVSTTSITCTTPAATAAGVVDVIVTTAVGKGTSSRGFTYIAGTIITVTPAFGGVLGGTKVTIKGVNFIAGCNIQFGTAYATHINFIDSQTYTCQTPANAVGFYDVTIIEPL